MSKNAISLLLNADVEDEVEFVLFNKLEMVFILEQGSEYSIKKAKKMSSSRENSKYLVRIFFSNE